MLLNISAFKPIGFPLNQGKYLFSSFSSTIIVKNLMTLKCNKISKFSPFILILNKFIKFLEIVDLKESKCLNVGVYVITTSKNIH